MIKAREFWIDFSNKFDVLCEAVSENGSQYKEEVNESEVHVIEYSAYDSLLSQAKKLAESLEYYANHESVIKEAYHSNDQKQIICVHTFINHKAKEALESWQEYLAATGAGEGK